MNGKKSMTVDCTTQTGKFKLLTILCVDELTVVEVGIKAVL